MVIPTRDDGRHYIAKYVIVLNHDEQAGPLCTPEGWEEIVKAFKIQYAMKGRT